jgi:methylated-DNA-[protein]-cysteine S-methyltransferase
MRVGIRTRNETLEGIRYLPRSVRLREPSSRLAERVVRQLERYRDNPDARFDLPLAIEGTPFQRRVWRVLERIPRGETRTYGDVAATLGSAARAVGQACGENRLPIVIPCHRVVAAGGIGGFGHARGGYLLEAKRWLLGHERAL